MSVMKLGSLGKKRLAAQQPSTAEYRQPDRLNIATSALRDSALSGLAA
jgi:hypothetical protein